MFCRKTGSDKNKHLRNDFAFKTKPELEIKHSTD